MSKVAAMLKLALSKVGVPYIWWAKGEEYGCVVRGKFEKRPVEDIPTAPPLALAYDCSGFVTWICRELSGRDLRWTHNTDKLWNEQPEVFLGSGEGDLIVQPGDLAFYGGVGPTDVSHVMVVLSVIPSLKEGAPATVLVIGASGGGSATTRPQPDAYVRVEATHLYRRDFRGFRRGLLRGS